MLSSSSATRVWPQPCGALCWAASPAAGASEANERPRGRSSSDARVINGDEEVAESDDDDPVEAASVEKADGAADDDDQEVSRAARAEAATAGKTRRNMVFFRDRGRRGRWRVSEGF